MIDRNEDFLRQRERRIDFLVMGGTAGSHYAARLLRRAAAGSSLKALLAAAVAATNSEFDRKVLNNFK